MAIIINLFEDKKLVITLKADNALGIDLAHATEKYRKFVENLMHKGIHDAFQNVDPEDEEPETYIIRVAMKIVGTYPELKWQVTKD